MNEDNKQTPPQDNEKDIPASEKPLKVHNPFKPGDDKTISQEDIDNEQKLKEAMTERD